MSDPERWMEALKEGLETLRREIDTLKDLQAREIAREVSGDTYRVVVENASEIIVVLFPDGTLRLVNPKASITSGYSPEEIVSTPFTDLVHPGDRDRVVENFTRRFRGEPVPHTYCFRYVGKQGQVGWVEIHAFLIQWEGRPATLIYIRDVTEQKQAEEEKKAMEAQFHQMQKLEAVGRLAGGVAHDFNNLLTVIKGYTDHLLMNRLEAEDPNRREVEEIRHAANRAASLTRQLLSFSRQQPIRPEILDLNDVLAGMDILLRRLIGEDIEVVSLPAGESAWVNADTGQMEQVLMNLALNARDAMPQGGTLTLRIRQVHARELDDNAPSGADAEHYVRLSVEDTGTGMDEACRRRVFEPFFTTKALGQGTGLGMAVVYGIVQQHGGRIDLQSEVGQGTRVSIFLPAGSVKRRNGSETSPADPGLHGNEERTLLVEDEPCVRSCTGTALSSHGYRVFQAESAEKAMQLFERENGDFQLILSDMVLPDHSGLGLAEQLRSRKPGIPVRVTSG